VELVASALGEFYSFEYGDIAVALRNAGRKSREG
jgi:hypothetical protein